MSYREDPDLAFLGTLSDAELEPLFGYLVYDGSGEERRERLTQTLTSSDEYKNCPGEHSRYWQRLAEELQCFGGHSLMNLWRGGGVLYAEIVRDVLDKAKVKHEDDESVPVLERRLLESLLIAAVEKMDEQDLKELISSLNLQNCAVTAQAVTAALQLGVRLNSALALQAASLVANTLSRMLLGSGLTLAGNAALSRALGVFAGPLGWALTGLWTAYDLAGPAYRVTLPCVVQIAFMRLKHTTAENPSAN
ncbi:MAG: DUF3944 domain-containing protein [Succinivibrio sp.]|nr:DUF3944 domain-containing protein [Succinivibrio sp.]